MSYLGLVFNQNREILDLLRSIKRDTTQLLRNDASIIASLLTLQQNGAKESDLEQVLTVENNNATALAQILALLVPQPIAGFTVSITLRDNSN